MKEKNIYNNSDNVQVPKEQFYHLLFKCFFLSFLEGGYLD